MKCKFSGFLALLLMSTMSLSAQGRGETSGGNSSGGNSSGSTAGNSTSSGRTGTQSNTTNDPFSQGQQNNPFASQARPLFLSGQVLTDDGQPPTESVVIQRICNGEVRPEGYSDQKGRFSFQLGGDPTLAMGDASVGGNQLGGGPAFGQSSFGSSSGIRQTGLGRYDLTACELRAVLPGYVSDPIRLGMRSAMDNPDVGVIVLRRMAGVVGNIVSATTLAAPRKADKAYQNGLKEMRKKKPNYKKGATQFQNAVSAYPQFAAAWAALGDAKMAMQDKAGAKEAFSKSLEADPKYLKPFNPLLQMALQQKDWVAVEDLGVRYLELNPNEMQLQLYMAIAALNNGNPEKAEEAVLAIRASDSKDNFPQIHQVMGLIHSQRGEFEEAASEYRAYLAKQPNGNNFVQIKKQLNEWEVLGVIEPELKHASAQ